MVYWLNLLVLAVQLQTKTLCADSVDTEIHSRDLGVWENEVRKTNLQLKAVLSAWFYKSSISNKFVLIVTSYRG